MPKILVLSQHIANRIAAGEVVERPASVVKELIENSIDAGADRIGVQIEDGGLKSILITDNGSGISREDCTTAFLRHATSKISSADDLEAIRTLGFRGEALASIAAVAEVSLLSKTADSEVGTRLQIDNGIIGKPEDAACNAGTSLRVDNLFLKVPARLKFLKSARTEAGYIGDYVARAIMAHPEIAFTYSSNGRIVYESAGDGDLKHALMCVYGTETLNHILPVSYDNGYILIEGYIGDAELSKPNRTYQSIYVNDRYIKSTAISSALSRAYETALTVGRFPLAVLKIKISFNEVDVNVHPAKTEIRFTDEHRVCSCIYAACREALLGASANAVILPPAVREETPAGAYVPPAVPSFSSAIRDDKPLQFREKVSQPILFPPNQPRSASNDYTPSFTTSFSHAADGLKIVGCVLATYWIAEYEGSVYLIDQHAAHERLLYEKLKEREPSFASQPLLISRILKLAPTDMSALCDRRELVEKLGYTWKPMDDNTIEILSVPQINGKTLDERYLFDCVCIFADSAEDVSLELIKDKLIQSACKHAVKAGDALSPQEILSLLSEFSKDSIPLTCPHGRPVIARITRADMEKLFKRIQ
ncbi:MAG: DNA mismatch repair endonuclease MutL [Clostridia bacterium]|nr:DNA mismatch repair endonuclease MutL [Clostridia bacterium]